MPDPLSVFGIINMNIIQILAPMASLSSAMAQISNETGISVATPTARVPLHNTKLHIPFQLWSLVALLVIS